MAEEAPDGAGAVVAVAGDASRPGAAQELVDGVCERYGRLDGFVAGAGAQGPVDVMSGTWEDCGRNAVNQPEG